MKKLCESKITLRRIQSLKKTTTTTTSTTSESTIIGTSTTSKYEESKRGKGKFVRTPTGKCVSLREYQATFGDGNDDDDEAGPSKKFKYTHNEHKEYQMKYKDPLNKFKFGYGDADQLLFPEKEESTALRIFKAVLSMFSGGNLLHSELRRR